MSQINVDTIGSQTGSNVQLASGHTLKDKDGTAFDTQSDMVKLHSVNVTSAQSTVDFFIQTQVGELICITLLLLSLDG